MCETCFCLYTGTDVSVCYCLRWSGKTIYYFIINDIIRFTVIISLTNISDIFYIAKYLFCFVILSILGSNLKLIMEDIQRQFFGTIYQLILNVLIVPFWIFGSLTIICLIFPSTCFHYFIIFGRASFAGKFFGVAFGNSVATKWRIYSQAILNYIFQTDHSFQYKNILKRIICVNYYLYLVFKYDGHEAARYNYNYVPLVVDSNKRYNFCKTVCDLHANFIINMQRKQNAKLKELNDMKWRDLWINDDTFSSFSVAIMFFIWMILDIYWVIYLYIRFRQDERYNITHDMAPYLGFGSVHNLFCVYLFIEMLYIPYRVRLCSLAFYSYFILNGLSFIRKL